MSHDHALQLQDRLELVLDQFEKEITDIERTTRGEELESVLESAEHLRTILVDVKNYFVEVRNQLSDVTGIPPAKELAQLVIGASTEALSAIRESLHYLEDVKDMLKTKRKSPLTREEIHYTDFSAKVAIRRCRYIVNQISAHAEELPQQL